MQKCYHIHNRTCCLMMLWLSHLSFIVTKLLYNLFRDLCPGDQIAVEVRGIDASFQYYHHGIFIGQEEGVIHFGGVNKANAGIKKDDLFAFIGVNFKPANVKIFRIVYQNVTLSPEMVINNAYWYWNNPETWKSFDILMNNCEHFATRCKIGTPASKQSIDTIKKFLRNPKTEYSRLSKIRYR